VTGWTAFPITLYIARALEKFTEMTLKVSPVTPPILTAATAERHLTHERSRP
jgi:hypothetical protein